ncbi:DUF962 domain-containing protein [Paenibacillus sp. sptzw28]|uniref:Mpo1-like protein n=1 Tax=Paenibacillus sp. sptzw28 TaxID=715179 RepID=UPI001C6EF234|nr:Mpo1-like protein [Paenibacillus sp. sptzw28]QYR21263.1 DUF962 domain-containing protein [Paenibacillus sp. sptzw28]
MTDRIRSDLRLYVMAHQNKYNQILHYFAFLSAFLAWIFVVINLWITLMLAILHYVLSWTGHYFFEGNKPAMIRYPIIGFYAGFIWFFIKTYELISRRKVLGKIINKAK